MQNYSNVTVTQPIKIMCPRERHPKWNTQPWCTEASHYRASRVCCIRVVRFGLNLLWVVNVCILIFLTYNLQKPWAKMCKHWAVSIDWTFVTFSRNDYVIFSIVKTHVVKMHGCLKDKINIPFKYMFLVLKTRICLKKWGHYKTLPYWIQDHPIRAYM